MSVDDGAPRVVIADDQTLVRGGFRLILGSAGIPVVAEAADGWEAVAATLKHRPDVVLMDIRMPGVDGLEATRRITSDPDLAGTRIVILTTFELDEYLFEALRVGASGFLVKDTEPVELIRGVRAVAAGDALLSPGVTRRLIDRLAADGGADDRCRRARERLAGLSPRDREIAEAIAEGKANAAIAGELHLSVATVKSHVSAILSALALDNRVQIALLVQDAQRA